MATEAAWACPVCSEALGEPADQCFRCETPLRSWWPFEEAARAVDGARAENLALRQMALGTRRSVASLVLAAAVGAGFAWAALRWGMPPEKQVALAPSVVPTAAPSPQARTMVFEPFPVPVSYRVQRGDSLWRIAAALTGDGNRWRSLFPSQDPSRPLQPGATLTVTLPAPGR